MDDIIKLQKRVEELTAENATLKKDAENSVKLKELKRENEVAVKDLETKIEDLEVQLKEKTNEINAMILLKQKEREAKWSTFLDDLQADKKLEPAKREEMEMLFKAYGDNDKLIDIQMNLLKGKEADIRFKEQVPGNNGQAAKTIGNPKDSHYRNA